MATGTADSTVRAGGRRWRIAAWGAAAALLLLPLAAMQFTDEVRWTGFDFAVFGALLATAGGVCEAAVRATGSRAAWAATAIAVATAFVLVMANGAVGLIGSEDNPANLALAGVIGIAASGAWVARFQAPGLARAMVAAALAQGLMAALALSLGDGRAAAALACCAAPWLVSAVLFRRAARGAGARSE